MKYIIGMFIIALFIALCIGFTIKKILEVYNI